MSQLGEQILDYDDSVTEQVVIPQWGELGQQIYVRALQGKERDQWEASLVEFKGKTRKFNFENLRARLVVKTVVDKEGNRVFTEQDVHKLGEKNAAALDKLYSVASRLSALSKSDQEEIVKNLESDQNEDST